MSESDAVLRRVLAQTLLASEPDPLIAAEHLQCLTEVACRHSGNELRLEPIVLEMVSAILCSIYKVGSQGREFSSDMVRAIANSVWEDETSRERIDRLWRRLREEAI